MSLRRSGGAILDFLAPAFAAPSRPFAPSSLRVTCRTASTSSLTATERSAPSTSAARSKSHSEKEADDRMANLRRQAARMIKMDSQIRQTNPATSNKGSNTRANSVHASNTVKKSPRAKPLHRHQQTPNTVDILQQIRSNPLQSTIKHKGKPTISVNNHNEAVLCLKRGSNEPRNEFSFETCFRRGWIPLRNSGQVARIPLNDLVRVLQVCTHELSQPDSTADWGAIKEMILWIAGGNVNMPGLKEWAWAELGCGLSGATRVISVWESILNKEHQKLRHGDSAINFAWRESFLEPNSKAVSKAPVALFAAYVAARSIQNSSLDTPNPFRDVFPGLLDRQNPLPDRFDPEAEFVNLWNRAESEKDSTEEIDLALAWIRQTFLAQLWFKRKELAGLGLLEAARIAFRANNSEKAWKLWESVQEGFDGPRVSWLDRSEWENSANSKWLSERDLETPENSNEKEKSLDTIETGTEAGEEIDSTPVPPNYPSIIEAHLSQPIVATFLVGFVRMNLIEKADEIWNWLETRSPPLKPGVVCWTALMQGYALRGDVNAVEQVFQKLLESGVKADFWCWMERISVLFKVHETEKAKLLMNEMFLNKSLIDEMEDGKFPTAVYSRLILGLLSNGELDQAESLLRKMETDSIPITIHTINNFLRHHTRSKRPNLTAVVNCLRLIAEKGIEPDVFTFTMILQALLATGQRDATAKLIRIMEQTGLKASVTTYGAIISHLAKTGDPQQLRAAVELVDEMESKRIATNQIIYTSIIQAHLKQIGRSRNRVPGAVDPHLHTALSLKQRMAQRGIAMNRVGYNILISAAMEIGSPETVQLALNLFKECNQTCDSIGQQDSWYILLKGVGRLGDWSLGRQLVKEMNSSGLKTFSAAMRKLVERIQRGGYAIKD